MKKLFVFCSSFLVVAGIVAQNTSANNYAPGSICSVFSKILAAVPEEFKAITSGKDQSIYAPTVKGWKKYGWKAPINFPGALVSYIEWTLFDPYKFTSFFGNEQSEEMARINLAIVKSQLTPCLSGFDTKIYDHDNPFPNAEIFGNTIENCPVVFEYTGKKAGKILPTVIQLKIKKDGSVYGVYLEVKEDTDNVNLNVRGAGVEPAKYDFCDMLKKIVFSAGSNFLNNCNFIKKEDIYNERGLYTLTGYKTDLILPGTLYCLIDFESDLSDSKVFNSTTDPAHYFSRIEGFNTETTARKRIEQIKNEIAACLVNYQVEKTSPNYYYYYVSYLSEIPLHYVFTQKKQTNQFAPKIILQIEKHKGDFFTINFIVTGIVNQAIPNNPETAVQPKETAQPKLAKQLQQLLHYAKDGFKAVKGEKIVDQSSKELKEQLANFYFDKKKYSKFKTSFLPEIADRSEIRDFPDDPSTKFIASYDYYLSAALTFQWLFKKLKQELGNDFTYEADEGKIMTMDYDKGQKAVFYRKSSKLPQLELIYNIDLDTITNGLPRGILIVVEALKKESTVVDNKPATIALTDNQTKLVKQLEQLLDHAKDGFKGVKGNINKELTEKYKIMGHTYYNTSFVVEGAIEKYIEEFGSSLRPQAFKAYFEKDLSYYESKKLFESLSEQLKQGFATGFTIQEDYEPDIDINIRTVRVQRKDDDSHYIELTLVDGESPAGDYTEVYIIVR